jgi:hypothetical protein
MAWFNKEHLTQFDKAELPIHGLLFVDGDVLAKILQLEWTKGMKSPMVMFPSNNAFPLLETSRPETGATVNLIDVLDLPLYSNRDEAFVQAHKIAEEAGYFVTKQGEDQLKIVGQDDNEHFLLTYDNVNRRIENVQRLREAPAPQPPLLDQASRERLPKLYSGETLGMDALAQVKFFAPDGGWTWYASEGSPVDENGFYDTDKEKIDFLFFGLVIGFEIEMGYFSLSELMSVRGALGLPVERDHDFEPTSLGKLKAKHEQERYRD